jgi:hypothetical protein
MKTVELKQATASLAEYARKVHTEGVVVTLRGRPLATVTAVPEGADWESLAIGMNPRFLAIIEQSREAHRKQGGISPDEMRLNLGIKHKRKRRRKTGSR